MNRYNALRIKLAPFMLQQDFQQYIEKYNIEWTVDAASIGETPCIWMGFHDEEIFQISPEPLEIMSGLKLWYDDGEKEIRIDENNWQQFNPLEFYKERKGTYDVIDEL